MKITSKSYYFFKNATDEEIIHYLEYVAVSMYILKSLFLLACITQYHQSYTRYCNQNGNSPREIYTLKHPLVNNFKEIASIVEIMTETLKFFYVEFKDYNLKI